MTERVSIVLLALFVPACGDDAPAVPFEARIIHRDASSPCADRARSAEDDSRCRCSIDCREGASCLSEPEFGIPGGACLRGCRVREDCASGWSCVAPATITLSSCRPECETSADCPRGRICMFPAGTSSPRVCLPQCSSDADCDSGECDLYRGLCDHATTGTRLTLERCIQSSECRSNWCAQPGGYCLSGCAISSGACPDGAVCVEDATPGDDAGVCLPRCFRQSDCGDPASIRCALTAVGASTAQVCIPESAVMR